MFNMEIVESNMDDDMADDVEYMSIESMRVKVDVIVMHI
jgi:hypothetical protein